MKWFKKPVQSADITLAEINTRIRGFLLDSQVNNAHEISLILGCASLSDELAEKEEEESEKRVEKISHLIPLLYAYSSSLATGSVEYQKSSLPENTPEIPAETWWESRKLLEQVSVAALLGSISQLVDMGLLDLPKKFR